MSSFDMHQFCLFNKTVSKLGIAEWKHIYISKFFCVSEFGKVEVQMRLLQYLSPETFSEETS
jgi:hypothetical protein